jgi:hypothetical protein
VIFDAVIFVALRRHTLAHQHARTHARTTHTHLDLAYDLEAIFSLKQHIKRHVPVPILHFSIGEEKLVLDTAHYQARVVLRFHEPPHRLLANTDEEK